MLTSLAKRLIPGNGPPSPERFRYRTLSTSPDSRRSSMVILSETPPLTQPGLLEPGVPHSSSETKVEWVHFVLGACVLVPWNVLITATPYFLSRLEGSPFRSTFSFYLSITMCIANFSFLLHAAITANSVDLTARIRNSTTTLTCLMAVLSLSCLLPLSPALFFAAIITCGILQSAMGSYMQNGVVALASRFGPSVMQSVMSGQAAVGIAVSLFQYATSAVSLNRAEHLAEDNKAKELTASMFIFFVTATVFMGSSLIGLAWLVRMPAYQAVARPFDSKAGLVMAPEEDAEEREDERFLVGLSPTPVTITKQTLLDIGLVNWRYNIAVCYDFAVTLAVFPPITTSITSVHTSSTSIIFAPVLFESLHFLIFNIGDWLGRHLCSYPRFLIWSPRKLFYYSLARTAFVPIFLMCNIQRATSSSSPSSPPIINSDILYLVILLAFGVTNGHLCSLCMMAAPSPEHNEGLKREYIDTAAIVAQFCLVAGLVIGAFASFAVRAAVCNCNPFVS